MVLKCCSHPDQKWFVKVTRTRTVVNRHDVSLPYYDRNKVNERPSEKYVVFICPVCDDIVYKSDVMPSNRILHLKEEGAKDD